jgi:hypothetical protein
MTAVLPLPPCVLSPANTGCLIRPLCVRCLTHLAALCPLSGRCVTRGLLLCDFSIAVWPLRDCSPAAVWQRSVCFLMKDVITV